MKYSEQTIAAIADAIKDGETVETACKTAGITKTTFYEWMADEGKTDFADAIKKAKDEFQKTIVGRLEHSLWKKALGFEFEERKTEVNKEGVKTKETVVKKYYPPDTAALIFALTNVAPEQWKNRQNIEATGRDGRDLYPRQSIDMDKLTAEQRELLLSIGTEIINRKE